MTQRNTTNSASAAETQTEVLPRYPSSKQARVSDSLLPRLVSLMLVLGVLAAPLPLAAQSDETDQTSVEVQAQEEIYSDQVDDREDSFRKSMELREDPFRDQPRANTTYTNRGSKEKIDQLPEESQENIKEQLGDMIIEHGEWQLGDEMLDYPYELSKTARRDARLAQQEREAWSEQLEKYQQREAAAYASEAGFNGEPGEQSQSAQQQAQQQGSTGEGANNPAQNSQQQSQDSPPDPNAQQSEDTAENRAQESPSTAGVSESALSFLQGKGSQPGQNNSGEPEPASSVDQASGQGGNSPQEGAAPGDAQQASESMQADEQQVAQQDADESAQAALKADQQADAAQQAAEQVTPGSLEIDELKQLQGLAAGTMAQASAQSAAVQVQVDSSGESESEPESDPQTQAATTQNQAQEATEAEATPQDQAEQLIEPGTLDIDDLDQIEAVTLQKPVEPEGDR